MTFPWGREVNVAEYTEQSRASQTVQLIKDPPANAGDAKDTGSSPGLGRSPGLGNGNPLQDTCLENYMNRGTCQATVHGVPKSWTWLSMHTRDFEQYMILRERPLTEASLDGTWERASRVLGKKPASNRSQASLRYQARWDVWKPVLWLRSTLAYGRAMHGSLRAWPWLVPQTESRSDW